MDGIFCHLAPDFLLQWAHWSEEMKSFLPGEHSTRSHAEVAARVGKSEDAVKMAVNRFRQEFGRLLKVEVRRIVDRSDAVEDELRCLLRALAD